MTKPHFIVERSERRLSLALWPFDQVTQRGGEALLDVRVVEDRRKAIRSVSGYYCFEELPKSKLHVRVRGAGPQEDWYLEQDREYDMARPPTPPATWLLVQDELVLSPAAGHPFANDPALFRVVVVDERGRPVEDARVNLVEILPVPAANPRREQLRSERGATSTSGACAIPFDASLVDANVDAIELRVTKGARAAARRIAIRRPNPREPVRVVLGTN